MSLEILQLERERAFSELLKSLNVHEIAEALIALNQQRLNALRFLKEARLFIKDNAYIEIFVVDGVEANQAKRSDGTQITTRDGISVWNYHLEPDPVTGVLRSDLIPDDRIEQNIQAVGILIKELENADKSNESEAMMVILRQFLYESLQQRGLRVVVDTTDLSQPFSNDRNEQERLMMGDIIIRVWDHPPGQREKLLNTYAFYSEQAAKEHATTYTLGWIRAKCENN